MASVSFRNVQKSFGKIADHPRHRASTSPTASSWCWSGPRAAASPRCCACWPGLEDITGGEILIDGRVVNELESKDRDIAMVFQSYALYPHMTVRREHGLQPAPAQGRQGASPSKRVADAAKILNLDPLLERYPRELSGGQRQRVAMGRAIVRDPKVFLFDEPLSNLDAKLRVAMRAEIKALHQRLKTTTVYVTHDQIEAMTMADRIVVMHDGIVEQIGTPLELYDRPDNLFVAQFIGSPAMNVIEGTLRRNGGGVLRRGARRALAGAGRSRGGRRPGRALRRPARRHRAGGRRRAALPAKVIVVEPTGAETELLLQVGEAKLSVVVHGRVDAQPDQTIGLAIGAAQLRICSTGKAGAG